MKKNLLLNIMLPTVVAPFFALSCQSIRESQDKYTYIKNFNNSSFFIDKNLFRNKKVENDFESLIHNPLIRHQYFDAINYDYINKTFIKPSKKKLSFHLASQITILTKDNNILTFDDDQVSSQDLPETNKGLGYETGLIAYKSKLNNNINSDFFIQTLKNAQSVSFKIKDNIHFVNSKKIKTNKKVTSSNYLTSFQNDKNANSLFQNYNLNYEKTLSDSNNQTLVFSSKDNSTHFDLFVLNEITNNLLFNPTLMENDEYLCFGSYILSDSKINQQIFEKNSFFKVSNTNNKELKKVVLKYNPLPIDNETYSLQSFNAYKQNLITETSLNLFNKEQQEQILLNKKIYGLTYNLKVAKNKVPLNYFYNFNLKPLNNFQFDEHFAQLFYGLSTKQLLNQKESILSNFNNEAQYQFRSILSLAINKISFIKKNNHNNLWYSYVPEDTILSGKDLEDSSYQKVYDAKNYINAELSLNKSLIFEHQYKDSYFDVQNLTNLLLQYKGLNFLELKKQMKKLLDDYFLNKNLNDPKVNFTIPIFETKDYNNNFNYEVYLKLIKELDQRLNPKIEFATLDNIEDKQYFITNQNINLQNNSIYYFFKTMFFENPNSWLALLANSEKLIDSFEQIKNFKDHFANLLLKIKDVSIENLSSSKWQQALFGNEQEQKEFDSKLQQYLDNLTCWEQIKLLYEFTNLIRIPINTNMYSNYGEYEQIMVQNYLVKPANDLGYNVFQDIKLK
ncbi:OppA family ABC transporter substrate-binding lipoprotein [Mycoplasmopsis hyopharyngis]|uniref:OppA family ABC transporter substrate-binding lipoprotein n=1 Tax=Mycoplasmopsis hyopharyngis TaxID=29558 RepID=UPI0038739399